MKSAVGHASSTAARASDSGIVAPLSLARRTRCRNTRRVTEENTGYSDRDATGNDIPRYDSRYVRIAHEVGSSVARPNATGGRPPQIGPAATSMAAPPLAADQASLSRACTSRHRASSGTINASQALSCPPSPACFADTIRLRPAAHVSRPTKNSASACSTSSSPLQVAT